MDFNKVIDLLKNNGYKLTNQRKIIIEALYHSDKPISMEEWLLLTKDKNPGINLSTIYRNIDVLEDLGLLEKIRPKDGNIKYTLNLMENHAHFLICKRCGKAEAIECCLSNEFKKIIEDKEFDLIEHNLELYGYCKECHSELDKK
ncbi:Fur family transcriptional regulator [Vallitalea sp.]|jgi:Fur family zinc uptake transcriptional regulator/Fur family ferric uptake transcriptional regulator|uniref:Fur family transcriptional regulator n=1 Tax=Vallitalea sp. TaxID=1882829 RepID=UPI0025F96541|nr:Fur family transcriptional regulator [Vallitalea sp.]MCT4687582.1 transcriptional repressor [Vallitalea sp.]